MSFISVLGVSLVPYTHGKIIYLRGFTPTFECGCHSWKFAVCTRPLRRTGLHFLCFYVLLCCKRSAWCARISHLTDTLHSAWVVPHDRLNPFFYSFLFLPVFSHFVPGICSKQIALLCLWLASTRCHLGRSQLETRVGGKKLLSPVCRGKGERRREQARQTPTFK